MAEASLDPARSLRRALGWNLACPRIDAEHGRDLSLGAHGIGVVEGMDCLIQSLEIALTTLQGSYAFDVTLGFAGLAALAEESDVALARERIRITVIETVRRDPRVRRVIDLDVDRGTGAPIRGEPPSDRGTVAVRVGFETVAGDQTTVVLGSFGAIARA